MQTQGGSSGSTSPAIDYSLAGIRLAEMKARAENLRIRVRMTDPDQLQLALSEDEIGMRTESRHATLLAALAQCEATIAALEYFPATANEGEFREDHPRFDVWLPHLESRPLRGTVVVVPDHLAVAMPAFAAD